MKLKALLLAAASSLTLAGCVQLGCFSGCSTHAHNSSSLVEFLYPRGSLPPRPHAIPQLRIPLRVGLAFLPTQHRRPWAHWMRRINRICWNASVSVSPAANSWPTS